MLVLYQKVLRYGSEIQLGSAAEAIWSIGSCRGDRDTLPLMVVYLNLYHSLQVGDSPML